MTTGGVRFGVSATFDPACGYHAPRILGTLPETGTRYRGLLLKILNSRSVSALGRALGE